MHCIEALHAVTSVDGIAPDFCPLGMGFPAPVAPASGLRNDRERARSRCVAALTRASPMCGSLCPVAAHGHAAPAPRVAFAHVVEPKRAGRAFALADESEVLAADEIAHRLRDRQQQGFRRPPVTHVLPAQCAMLRCLRSLPRRRAMRARSADRPIRHARAAGCSGAKASRDAGSSWLCLV